VVAEELERLRLGALEAPDLDVVREAARHEEPAAKRLARLLEPTLDVVGMIDDHELGRLLTAVSQPGCRVVHHREPRLLVAAQVPEGGRGVRGGDYAPVHEDAGVQVSLCGPLEHLGGEGPGDGAVQEGLAAHPPDHRAAVADDRVLVGEAEPPGVLARPLEAPPRRHDEPHPPAPELVHGGHGPLRDLQVAPQDGPVEVEGAQLEGQPVLFAVVSQHKRCYLTRTFRSGVPSARPSRHERDSIAALQPPPTSRGPAGNGKAGIRRPPALPRRTGARAPCGRPGLPRCRKALWRALPYRGAARRR
jgi:hypothetical protein